MPIVQLPTTPDSSEIRVTKGTVKSFAFAFGVDLTASMVRIDVRRGPLALDILLTKALVIQAPATDGNVTLDFLAADYASIAAGFYNYSIVKTTSGNDTVLQTGQFTLEPFDQSLVGQIEPIMRLAITNSQERVSIEIRDSQGVLADPVELQVDLLDFGDHRVQHYNLGDPGLSHPEGGIFYFEFQSNRSGDYLAIWSYRFTGEEPQSVVKNIRWVTPAIFRMIPELRLYIDKARKASNKTIAFNPIDCAEYIQLSLYDFNSTPPTTDIALELFDGSLRVYREAIVMGAILQALVAQGLLAVDQDFQYNDNGISLAIDHSSKLMSWYTTLLQTYVAKKRLLKLNFFAPTVLARTVIGQAFALGLSKVPASTLSRFRGWI